MVSYFETSFKALEGIQLNGETIIVISRIIPKVWSTLQSHGYQEPNKSESSKLKKKKIKIPLKESLSCSVTLYR